jgi:hypothetical protein
MKKALAILTALLPVIYAISMQLSVFLIKGDEALFAMLGIFLLIGFLLPVSFSIATAAADKRFLAICNLWFYAGNLLLFAYEIVLWCIRYHEEQIAAQNGAMEGGLGLALLIIIAYMPHWIIYLCVRVAGAISCARSLRGTDGTQGNAVLTGMQLFPITDLISSILVLRKVKAFQACQQSPIEMK